MSAAKIQRQQKAFLKAMKEKFAEGLTDATLRNVADPASIEPVHYTVIDCPICRGRGYHGPKSAFCQLLPGSDCSMDFY